MNPAIVRRELEMRNKPAVSRPDQIEGLLARSALFRLLALGFSFPRPGHVEEIRQALTRLSASRIQGHLRPRLTFALGDARRAWLTAANGLVNSEYVRLFHGSGPVSLHETAYGDGRRIAGRAVEIADISGFYRAFGFSIAAADPDLPDHLGVELEFMSLLLLRESQALSAAWPSRARLTRDAAKTYLEDHLGRWTKPFARALTQAGAARMYTALGRLLQEAVDVECRRLRARASSVERRLPPDPMEDDTFVCPVTTWPPEGSRDLPAASSRSRSEPRTGAGMQK
jgi:DMSO reductase family type II enzyme chaperone